MNRNGRKRSWFVVTVRVPEHRFSFFSWGPEGFREVRGAGRNHFHLSWYFSNSAVPGGQKPWEDLLPSTVAFRGASDCHCPVDRSDLQSLRTDKTCWPWTAFENPDRHLLSIRGPYTAPHRASYRAPYTVRRCDKKCYIFTQGLKID